MPRKTEGFRVTIGEFFDLEVVIGGLDTNGTEEYEFTRFEDGEIAMKIWRDGEAGTFCRLGDWAHGKAV